MCEWMLPEQESLVCSHKSTLENRKPGGGPQTRCSPTCSPRLLRMLDSSIADSLLTPPYRYMSTPRRAACALPPSLPPLGLKLV